MGTTSAPPIYLYIQDLPSNTGRPAVAPISPRPKIEVPLVIIAHQLDLKVSSLTIEGF